MRRGWWLRRFVRCGFAFLVLSGLLVKGGAVVAAEMADETTRPIKIGAIFSLTGLAARDNRSVLEVVRLTVDRVNRRGGVLGRPLELTVFDNKSTSIGSLEAAHRAVAAGMTAVIGAHWSSHSLAMAPYLQKKGVVMISPASTNPEVTRGKDYIFRAGYIDTAQGKAMAWFARQKLEIARVAVLFNIDERYSSDLARYFHQEFVQQGGGIVYQAGYRGDSADFSSVIDDLLVENPQAVYIPGYMRDTALFIKQARTRGLQSVFLGGDGWELICMLLDKELDGSYQTVLWHPDLPYPEVKRAKGLLQETMDRSFWNLSAPLGNDAVRLLVDAIERAGSTDRVKIRDALAATSNFHGVAGPITFDSNGDPLNRPVIIVKIMHGNMEYVTSYQP